MVCNVCWAASHLIGLSDWFLSLDLSIFVYFSLAGQPGAALEQTHIFCLAHVLRRPIIVYGVKVRTAL